MWGENSGVAVCLTPGGGDIETWRRRWLQTFPQELGACGRRSVCWGHPSKCCQVLCQVVMLPYRGQSGPSSLGEPSTGADPCSGSLLEPFSFEFLGTRGAEWDLSQFRWATVLWVTRLPHSVCSQSCCGHKGQAEGAHLGNVPCALSSGLRMVFCQENCPDGALCCLQLLSAAVCMAEEVGEITLVKNRKVD